MGRGVRGTGAAAISSAALRSLLVGDEDPDGDAPRAPWLVAAASGRALVSWQELRSSNVRRVAWESGSLYVEFHPSNPQAARKVYRSDDVDQEVYRLFVASDSPGRFYNREIRGIYDGAILEGDKLPLTESGEDE